MGYFRAVFILSATLWLVGGEPTPIRLAEGTDINGGTGRSKGSNSGAKPKVLVPSRPPHSVSEAEGGPLLPLTSTACFAFNESRYEYEFCPFDNITQTEIKNKRNRFILGMWESRNRGGASFDAHTYSDGDDCPGVAARRTTVAIQCDAADFAVGTVAPRTLKHACHATEQLWPARCSPAPARRHLPPPACRPPPLAAAAPKLSEPSTCNYTMAFRVPVPCGLLPGAAPAPDLDAPTAGEEGGSAAVQQGRRGPLGAIARALGRSRGGAGSGGDGSDAPGKEAGSCGDQRGWPWSRGCSDLKR